ncbi:MAG: hypothetical protein CM15mP58_12890 [Burkholderiaceae bacterium]|nr:MAG: hypothetical protein CM15mP58_12890 [Burkholderiaceae bacterium]
MARAALETWKIAKKHSPRKIWAIAGPGNNGGDAIMTLALLYWIVMTFPVVFSGNLREML